MMHFASRTKTHLAQSKGSERKAEGTHKVPLVGRRELEDVDPSIALGNFGKGRIRREQNQVLYSV